MLKILKNAHIYSPENLGKNDILIANDKILAIDTNLDSYASIAETYDFSGQIITPGLIDQHIHIAGAGGTSGFFSMTPEVHLSDLIACGSTTVVGLLGTDGKTRSIRTLYGKVKSLEQEGISAYMYCGYYGIDSVTITDSIQSDMIFIDKVLGCKIAICDIRSSYPTALELLRKVSEVRVGGSVANKKGILHIHLGNLDTKMDVLFELVQKHQFPIAHISPTHVGRTKELFEQAIEFAKLGGTIDITTGASKFTEPYKAVLMALENGAPLKNITFSTDGHAGLRKINENGKFIGAKVAPVDQNLHQVIQLIQKGGLPIEDAFQLITTNPAKNLGLNQKGKIEVGCDADICVFNQDLELTNVFAMGKQLMQNKNIIVKGTFETTS